MPAIVTGVFFVLHGLIHFLYLGHTRRLFELRPRLAWPDGSWAFSRLLGDENVRRGVSVSLLLAAIGFVVSGMGLLFGQAWWRPVVVASAALSIAVWGLCWDGAFQAMDAKGGVAVLINLAILAAVLVIGWPS